MEYLKGWRKEANCEKYPEGRRWDLVLQIVKVVFRDGKVRDEIAWAMIVLLLKGKGEYRGIGIV